MEAAKPGQYLSFNLSELSYALPISAVREINRVLTITPIPETPDYIAGVMNLRGKVIPIVDMRCRFGMPMTPYTKQTCVIVVDSPKGQAGLLVDSIHGVTTLNSAQIEPKPQLSGNESSGFVIGMGKLEKKVLILVDVGKILMNAPIELPAQAA
jgi:purine-binding chemotaxis protein CheW